MINEQHAEEAIKRKPQRESDILEIDEKYWCSPRQNKLWVLPQHEAAIESNLPDKKIQRMKLKLHSNIQKYQ